MNFFSAKRVTRIFLLTIFALSGCVSMYHSGSIEYPRMVRFPDSATSNTVANRDLRMIIRYPVGFSDALNKEEFFYTWYNPSAEVSRSMHAAFSLYATLRARYPNISVLLQPIKVGVGKSDEIDLSGKMYKVGHVGKNIGSLTSSFEEIIPGATVYIDLADHVAPEKKSPPIYDSMPEVFSSFGRWMNLDLRVFSAKEMSVNTNGVLGIVLNWPWSTNFNYNNHCSLGGEDLVRDSMPPSLYCHYFDQVTPLSYMAMVGMNGLMKNGFPYEAGKVVALNGSSSLFALDERKLISPSSLGVSGLAESSLMDSVGRAVYGLMSELDAAKANRYSSVSWIEIYDYPLARNVYKNSLSPVDKRKLALLSQIEMEELRFLQGKNDLYVNGMLFGAWGETFRMVRAKEDELASSMLASATQAQNAQMVSGLSALHGQLSSMAASRGGVDSGLNGLSAHLNAMSKISQSAANLDNSAKLISSAGKEFEEKMTAFRNQHYKFVSQKTGGTVEVSAGSLAELRYQFLQLYRAEAKNLQ
jgi:hypothetical protein